MLWPYEINASAEQLNVLKLDDYGITPMEKFLGPATDITLKTTIHGDVQFMS